MPLKDCKELETKTERCELPQPSLSGPHRLSISVVVESGVVPRFHRISQVCCKIHYFAAARCWMLVLFCFSLLLFLAETSYLLCIFPLAEQ